MSSSASAGRGSKSHDRPAAKRFATIALILIGASLLLLPTVVNRGPFFISDTTTYVRGADAAVFRLLGRKTDWSDHLLARYATPAGTASGGIKGARERDDAVTLAGRSIYYGAFLYLCDQLAGLRLAVFLQALAAAVCLWLTVTRFSKEEDHAPRRFLLLMAILSIGSSLPFFAGYLMPDIFVSLGILAASHLLTPTPPIDGRQRAFWFAILGWSTLSHSSATAVIAILAVASLCIRSRRQMTRTGLILTFCAIAVGIFGEIAFYAGVRSLSGEPPVRPPFLMARLVADGPGRTYLKAHCPQSGFVLCRHMDSLSDYSDSFLWSESARDGVFSVVPSDERRKLSNEEWPFVKAVVAEYPVQVLRSSIASIWTQATSWGLAEFNLTPPQSAELEGKLPPRVTSELSRTRADRNDMPVRASVILSAAATLAGLFFVVAALLGRERADGMRRFLALLLFGVVADIVVCGALSTPHARYAMRVLWLIPAAGLLGAWSWNARQRRFRLRPKRAASAQFDIS